MDKPIIMVSSTFYDLKQIRSELHLFIENLGYESLLSESPTFPVNPEIGTIDNCKKTVEMYADILILIIGGRYGSIDDRSGKSVTNLEYIEARNKGIPIYVFIDSKILNYIDIWKKNKEADFSSVVDTIEVFEFIERIRNTDSVWIFPFNVVNDIKNVITLQLAYLFKTSLNDWLRLHRNEKERLYDTLSSNALVLVLEKPAGWEYRLLFQVWLDELDKISEKIYDYQHNLKIFHSELLRNDNVFEWIQLKFHEMEGFIDSANYLINDRAQVAFGPPGMPGDEKEIIMVARNIVRLLSIIIDWCIKIRLIKSEEPFTRILNAMSLLPESVIKEMQDFPHDSLGQLKSAFLKETTDNPQHLKLSLVFDISNMGEYEEAFDVAKRYYGLE